MNVNVQDPQATLDFRGYGLQLEGTLYHGYSCINCRLMPPTDPQVTYSLAIDPPLIDRQTFSVGVASHMMQHLQRHLDAGHDVPKVVTDTVRKFAVIESQESLTCGLTR